MKRLALCSVSLTLAGALATLVLSTPVAFSSEKQARFPQLKVEELNDQQRPVADYVLTISSVGISGPYNPMLRSPMMADRLVKLLDYLRFNTTVPKRLNEFAILIQGRLWTSQIEWVAHYPLAIKAGLSESVANDLKDGKRPANMQPDEAVVYDLCMEASTKHAVSDATFKRAREIFSEQQVVDLIMVSGTYASVAMLANTAEEKAPGGKAPLAPLPADK
jgi:4-carboxymuconolactone decarboxylase